MTAAKWPPRAPHGGDTRDGVAFYQSKLTVGRSIRLIFARSTAVARPVTQTAHHHFAQCTMKVRVSSSRVKAANSSSMQAVMARISLLDVSEGFEDS